MKKLSEYSEKTDSVSLQGRSLSRGQLLWAVLLLVLIQGGIRLWVIGSSEGLAPDAPAYLHLSKQIFHGEDTAGTDSFSGYSWFLAQLMKVAPDAHLPGSWIIVGRLISFTANLLFLLGGWLLLCQLFKRPWLCYLGVMVWGLTRYQVFIGCAVLTDALVLCIQVWALAAGIWALKKYRREQWLAFGIASLFLSVILGLGNWVSLFSILMIGFIGLYYLTFLFRKYGGRCYLALTIVLMCAVAWGCGPPLKRFNHLLAQKNKVYGIAQVVGSVSFSITDEQRPIPRFYDSSSLLPADRLPWHESVWIQVPYQITGALHPVLVLGFLLYLGLLAWCRCRRRDFAWKIPIYEKGIFWGLGIYYVLAVGMHYQFAGGISARYFHIVVLMVTPMAVAGFLGIADCFGFPARARLKHVLVLILVTAMLLVHSVRPINAAQAKKIQDAEKATEKTPGQTK